MRERKRVLSAIVLIGIFIWGKSEAQTSVNERLFEYATLSPSSADTSVERLSNYLIAPATNDKQKLELFCYWISQHISYDIQASLSNNIKPCEARSVLYKKMTVCEGYANLFKELCDNANIKCYVVKGYAKGFSYKNGTPFKKKDHAWNAVYIDGSWILCDPTWASGYVHNSSEYIKHIDLLELFSSPLEFIKIHLPADPMWQLSEHPITMKAFVNEIYSSPSLPGIPAFAYLDSIRSFERLANDEKDVRTSENSYDFFPIDEDLAIAYYNYALTLPKKSQDLNTFRKSIQYFTKALALARKSTNYDYANVVSRCDRGIRYCQDCLEKYK